MRRTMSREPASPNTPPPPAVTRAVSPTPAAPAAGFAPPFMPGRVPQGDATPPRADTSADEWSPGEDTSTASASFPLDAFFIPDDAQRLPTGYDLAHDEAEHLADRLEQLARQVRARGLGALGEAAGHDELTRAIAAAVAGYVQRAD